MEGSEQQFSESPPESVLGFGGCLSSQADRLRYYSAAYKLQLISFELLIGKAEVCFQ